MNSDIGNYKILLEKVETITKYFAKIQTCWDV